MQEKYPQIFSSDIPDATNIEFESLHPAQKKVLYVQNILFFLVLVAISIVSYLLIDEFKPWIFYTSLGLLIFCFLFILLLVHIGFKHKGFAIGEKDIHYKTGYLTRSIKSIPMNRIQHQKIQQGVFEKYWQLAKLEIYTAGDSSGDLTIPGIPFSKAVNIQALITEKIKEYDRDKLL